MTPDPVSGAPSRAFAAVDLGATSGRVVLGRVRPATAGDGARLQIQDVHRFPNQPVRIRDGLHWDILDLYRNVIEGLRKAVAAEPDLVSVGIDSWAIDYGLVKNGRLVSTPYHYRDERVHAGVSAVHQVVSPAELYATSGLQHLPFNTVYQLAVDHADGLLDADTTMLLVPDLLAYWLTGQQHAERTNASTTGLLGVATGRWNDDQRDRLGLPPALLPPLVDPGQRIGPLTPDVALDIAGPPLDVVAVGSHDTASAVVAVPMTDPQTSAYICSGTWSLVGIETPVPILTDASRAANFTNEVGVDGQIRFLRNAMGMWLLNECINAWRRAGQQVDVPRLVDQAAHVDRFVQVDVDDPSLVPAGDMPSRVAALTADHGLPDPTPAQLVRSILESLATSYAATLDQLEQLSDRTLTTVHIVGGASQNALLCRLIAERSGRTVLAGPVEATATGNILVQARAAGVVTGTLQELRALIAACQPPVTYASTG